MLGSLIVMAAHIILSPYLTRLQDLPQWGLGYLFNGLKIIVPCFYMISGFLVYQGWSHAGRSRSYIIKYATRFTLIYLLFCLAFAVEFVIPVLIRDFNLPQLMLQAKIMFMVFALNGPYIQLWFFPPLIFGVLASFFLLTRYSNRVILTVLTASFLSGQLAFGTLRALLDKIFGGVPLLETRWGSYAELFIARDLGYGLTFVLLGALLAKHEEAFTGIRLRNLLIPSAALFMLESALLVIFIPWRADYSLSLGMLPLSAVLFYGVLRIRNRGGLQARHSFINLFSMVIFLAHIPLIKLNGWMLSGLHLSATADLTALGYFVITFAECLLTAYLIYAIYNLKSSLYSL